MIRRTLIPFRLSSLPSRPLLHYVPIRHASLNSAIERGLRKSRTGDDFEPRRHGNDDRYGGRRRGSDDAAPRSYGNNDRYGDRRRDSNGSTPRVYGNNDRHGNGRRDSEGFAPRRFGNNDRRGDRRGSSGGFDRSGNGRSDSGGFAPKRFDNNDRHGSGRSDSGGFAPKRFGNNDRHGNGRSDSGGFAPRRSGNNDRYGDPRGGSKSHKDIEQHEPALNMFDADEFIKTGLLPSMTRTQPELVTKQANKVQRTRRIKDLREERREARAKGLDPVKEHVITPQSIPYTTPASEFVYGTNAVEAAIRCGQRQIYVLYVYQAAGEELGPAKLSLRKLALAKGVKVKMAFGNWSSLLDSVCEGRAHNGVVLEASPLPKLPVTVLKAVSSIEDDHFRVELGVQSREEAAVNGLKNTIPILSQHRKRYPVVLLVDGIVDTGNLGAIIRSAYFLGIDAVVFAGRNSAPLNPAAMKASAGAAENMTLLNVSNEVAFIKQSKANGWRFYAADSPGLGSTLIDQSSTPGEDSGLNPNRLGQAPSVIMMGSESSGLASHIKAHADSIVSIPGARLDRHIGVGSDPARVDSLNVSVAAALLMEMFLRIPIALSEVPQKGGVKKG